jgi:hypothetical protein
MTITLPELERSLWSAANALRGPVVQRAQFWPGAKATPLTGGAGRMRRDPTRAVERKEEWMFGRASFNVGVAHLYHSKSALKSWLSRSNCG